MNTWQGHAYMPGAGTGIGCDARIAGGVRCGAGQQEHPLPPTNVEQRPTVCRPPAVEHSRYLAALMELGIRDDTLISLEIKAGVMTTVEHLLDADGRIVIGCTVTREREILPARPL